jgi:hypothetical protein
MVYASIKEAWGVDEIHVAKPMENPYVVKDPVQDPANFKKFRKDNFGSRRTNRVVESAETDDESYDSSNKKYRNLENETRYFRQSHRDMEDWCEPNYSRRYFTDEDEYSDVTSDEVTKKVIGKKIRVHNPKGILKRHNGRDHGRDYGRHRDLSHRDLSHDNVHEGFENSGKKVDCLNMLGHLKNCRVCRAEFDEYSKNVFIREFIIFAGCGVLMLLLLDLLRKIAIQKK